MGATPEQSANRNLSLDSDQRNLCTNILGYVPSHALRSRLIRLLPVGCKVPFGANSDKCALQRSDTLQKERGAEITSIDLVPQVGSVLLYSNLSQFLR